MAFFGYNEELFEEKIADAKRRHLNDPEQLGLYHYYLLRAILRENILVEDVLSRRTYEVMTAYFKEQEALYQEEVWRIPLWRTQTPEQKVRIMQCKAFYQLMDRYYAILEASYRAKNFHEAAQRAYVEKLNFRKASLRFSGDYLSWLGYAFFSISCRYGTSFFRWGVTSMLFVMLFAGIVQFVDTHDVSAPPMIADAYFIDYLYFSTVTFTTLGYGDIVPLSHLERLVVSIEVCLGYIMLGMFVGLIQKRLT
jgi:hypothetical protein